MVAVTVLEAEQVLHAIRVGAGEAKPPGPGGVDPLKIGAEARAGDLLAQLHRGQREIPILQAEHNLAIAYLG